MEDIIKKALKRNNLEFAIDAYSQISDKTKAKIIFKKYLDKKFEEMDLNGLSSIACIFVDDEKYRNEYSRICAKINNFLERRTI